MQINPQESELKARSRAQSTSHASFKFTKALSSVGKHKQHELSVRQHALSELSKPAPYRSQTNIRSQIACSPPHMSCDIEHSFRAHSPAQVMQIIAQVMRYRAQFQSTKSSTSHADKPASVRAQSMQQSSKLKSRLALVYVSAQLSGKAQAA